VNPVAIHPPLEVYDGVQHIKPHETTKPPWPRLARQSPTPGHVTHGKDSGRYHGGWIWSGDLLGPPIDEAWVILFLPNLGMSTNLNDVIRVPILWRGDRWWKLQSCLQLAGRAIQQSTETVFFGFLLTSFVATEIWSILINIFVEPSLKHPKNPT
jgi:hypothetical protein